jgi:hypothetical protein
MLSGAAVTCGTVIDSAAIAAGNKADGDTSALTAGLAVWMSLDGNGEAYAHSSLRKRQRHIIFPA